MASTPHKKKHDDQHEDHSIDDHDDHDDHGSHQAHEEHEGGHDEPWLVSYADMMTLLFGFFVIMYSFANAKNKDEEEWFKIKREISAYFGGDYTNPVDPIAEELKKAIQKGDFVNEIEVKVVGDSLELVMQSKVIFSSGSAEIINEQKPLVDQILSILIEKDLRNYSILVEGHTDDVPISTKIFRSNWDLSAARASTVAMMLQNKEYDTDRLSIRAFGQFKPIVPNKNEQGVPIEENRAKNRRIVIKLIADKD